MKRLFALIIKESLQIRRDPSSLLLAFVIPVLMILLFGFCINLDSTATKVALVLEDEAPTAHRLVECLAGSPDFELCRTDGRDDALRLLQLGKAHAALFVPSDFSRIFESGGGSDLLLATDGSAPNTAQFSSAYIQSACSQWLQSPAAASPGLSAKTAYLFNPTADSTASILPGTIAVVLSFIGSFLTAMVVAREWERGTMEAILASPASRLEFVLSKLIPYFVLGLCAMGVCTLSAIHLFDVPLRAPWWQPFAAASVFLFSVLSIGLLISTLVRSQYSASLIALMVSMLPTMLLSGFVFEVSSMPQWLQAISCVIPACHFVPALSTLFLAGGAWSPSLWESAAALAVFAVLWTALVIVSTPRRLDS